MKYEIKGGNLPVVVCELEANESVVSEAGAMSWMSPNMKMETGAGGIGKALGRMLTKESMFRNTYTAEGGNGMIAFASSFPGEIRAIEVGAGRTWVVQKSAFLASQPSVNLDIVFQKKLGAGFFGGEGFIMQKLSGSGTAFIEIDGSAVEYELAAGQSMILDTGYLIAMEDTCTMDVKTVSGVKNIVFGGEGLFNTVVSGPGRIIIQSMPVSAVAGVLRPFIPTGK